MPGAKTGRSPKDKHVVRGEEGVEQDVWRGGNSPNQFIDRKCVLV